MKKEASVSDYHHRIIESVVSFLMESGLSVTDISGAVEKALIGKTNLGEKVDSANSLGGNADTIFALVLHRWHREPALLDEDAKPLPMRLLGEHPSVEAMVAAEKPEAPAKRIALSMKNAGLVTKVKAGQYLPVSRIATVSSLHPMLVEHVTNSVVRYLGTIRQNTSSTRRVPTLIERYTHVPDLNESDVGDFRNFAQSHGSGFLASVDDWLERRRAKKNSRKSESGVSAGIHVFAYLEERKPPPKTKRRAKRA